MQRWTEMEATTDSDGKETTKSSNGTSLSFSLLAYNYQHFSFTDYLQFVASLKLLQKHASFNWNVVVLHLKPADQYNRNLSKYANGKGFLQQFRITP